MLKFIPAFRSPTQVKMVRTRQQKDNDPPSTSSSCDRCEEVDSEMVQCDTCNQFTHFQCANVDKNSVLKLKSWLCLACESTKKTKTIRSAGNSPALAGTTTPVDSATASTHTKSSTQTSGTKTQPLATQPPAPLSDLQKQEKQFRAHLDKIKRDLAHDLERERSKIVKAEEEANEALLIAETFKKELEEIKASHAKLKEETELALTQSEKEKQKMRRLYEASQAELTKLQQSQVPKPVTGTAEIQTDPTVTEIEVPTEMGISDRLNVLRLSLSNDRQNQATIPQSSNKEMSAASHHSSAEQLTASIMSRFTSVVSEMVKEMVPGATNAPSTGYTPAAQSAPIVQPPVNSNDFERPGVQRQNSFDSVKSDSVFNFSFHDEVADGDRRQESSVDKLAVTMSRRYLTKLPEFDGESVKKWPYFESVFESTTLQGRFSETDNINRLREALKGKAERVVKSHLMFPISATEIMNELREAFGKPDQILRELTMDLLKVSPMRSQIDVNLRSFSTELRNYVASLIKMNLSSALENVFVLVQLEEKLHHGHRREWIAHKLQHESSGKVVTIRTFAEFVRARAKELPPEHSSRSDVSAQPGPDKKFRRLNTHVQGTIDSSSAFAAKSCFKCKGSHVLLNCPEFKQFNPKERSRFVFESKICSSCLKSIKHNQKDCRAKRACNTDGCQYFHHPMLHYAKRNQNPGNVSSQQNQNVNVHVQEQATSSSDESPLSAGAQTFAPASSSDQSWHTNCTHQWNQLSHNNENSVLFKILPVRIHHDGSFIDTFAFLDDGSSLTLIEKEIYNSLGMSGSQEQLHLQWTKGITRVEEAFRTTVTISSKKSRVLHNLTNVYAVEHLDLPSQSVDARALKSRYAHLRGIPIPDFENAKPQILIGLQHSMFLLSTNNHSGGKHDPIAVKTQLGWTVFGNAAQVSRVVSLTDHKPAGVQLSIRQAWKGDDELHNLVKEYFTTEKFGVMPPKKDLISEENERAIGIRKRDLRKDDNLYPIAMSKFVNLERSLNKKPKLLKRKIQHVRDFMSKGYTYARKARHLFQRLLFGGLESIFCRSEQRGRAGRCCLHPTESWNSDGARNVVK